MRDRMQFLRATLPVVSLLMVLPIVISLSMISLTPSLAIADFQEIMGDEEPEAPAFKPIGQPAAEPEDVDEEALAKSARDRDALRKCEKSFDYSVKRKALSTRLAQASMRHNRVVETTKHLETRHPDLAKERRSATQKELDDLNSEIKSLEDGCTGNKPAKAGDAPKDTAPSQKGGS